MFKLFSKGLCKVCEKPKNDCECPKSESEFEAEPLPEPETLSEVNYSLIMDMMGSTKTANEHPFKLFSTGLCKVCEKPKNECECPKPEPEFEAEPLPEPETLSESETLREPETLPESEIDWVLMEKMGSANTANVQSTRRHPTDTLGYASKFCYFIPLKTGAIIVCVFSFVWSGAEIMGAEKQIADIFPDRLLWFEVIKTIYMLLCIGLLLATCVLMIGIIQGKYVLINAYLWYAWLYTVLFLILTIIGLLVQSHELGHTPGRKVLRLIAVAIWVTLLTYFLVVVNSFKYTLW